VRILLNRHAQFIPSQTSAFLSHNSRELAATEMFYDSCHVLGRDKRDVTSPYWSVVFKSTCRHRTC